MPQFSHPYFLALFLPLVLLFLFLRTKPQPAYLHPHLELLQGLPRGRARWVPWVYRTLFALGLTSLVIAIAGPRTPDLKTRLPAQGLAITLVVDSSGSMNSPDYLWDTTTPISRLTAAKRTFRVFVEGGELGGSPFPGRAEDSFALVTFAAVPETACPLTLNHAALLKSLDAMKPKDGIDAGTNIGDALAEALIRLESAKRNKRAIILLSDGEHNLTKEGPDAPLTPRQAAQLAANLGIPVYTIDCGTDPAAITDAEERARRKGGRQALADVATLTNGKTFTANDGPALQAALKEIDKLERAPQEAVVYRKYAEHGFWFVLMAGVCLSLSALIKVAVNRITPSRAGF